MRYLLVLLLSFTANAAQLGDNPIVLVHGWGFQFLVSMKPFRNILVDAGVPANRIHLVKYSSRASVDVITNELASQYKKVLES